MANWVLPTFRLMFSHCPAPSVVQPVRPQLAPRDAVHPCRGQSFEDVRHGGHDYPHAVAGGKELAPVVVAHQALAAGIGGPPARIGRLAACARVARKRTRGRRSG